MTKRVGHIILGKVPASGEALCRKRGAQSQGRLCKRCEQKVRKLHRTLHQIAHENGLALPPPDLFGMPRMPWVEEARP